MKGTTRVYRLLLFFALFAAVGFAGCKREEQQFQKTGDVEYTVLEEGDVPKELMDVIQEKRQEPFRITFLTEDALYIAKGYGEKPTGGYSIAVEELFLAAEGVCIRTTLLGPAKDEKVIAAKTWPYLVVKMKATEEEVFFLE